ASLRLLDLPALWILVLVAGPLLALVAWIGYAREDFSLKGRLFLAAMRFLSLAALCGVLARPVLVERREEIFPAQVAVLIDDSASMQREEAYAGDSESRTALESLGFAPAEAPSRGHVARKVLDEVLLPRLERRDYEPQVWRFDERARPLLEGDGLESRGQGTHVGDAVLRALQSARGRNLTEIVVLSDGRSNGGTQPLEAARIASVAGVPVHTVTIGDTRPERNAVIELVEAPETALEGDELSFTVRIVGRGSAEGERAEVLVEELVGSSDRARLIDQRELELESAGRRLLLVAPPGTADPVTGERRFRLRIPPLPEETLTDDNQIEIAVRVSPEKVRVLYVEGYPRWEYRRLALDFLRRAESDIEFRGWLASATPGFPQEHSVGVEPLEALPTDSETLLELFDVVVLGDVNPLRLFPDPAVGDEFLQALREFVVAGGGLLFQAGEYDNPRAFLGTPLQDVLPVVIEAGGDLLTPWDTSVGFRSRLEQPLAPHEIVTLDPDVDLNRELWEEDGGLHPHYWYSPVTRAKPGAEVLLRHPSAENDFGPRPLLVTGYFPEGRTLFLALDSTWRWQFRFGSAYFERFWRNALRWLALGRLRSGDRQFRVETERSRYDLSERVVVEARVLDDDFAPLQVDTYEVRWEGPEGRAERLALPAVPERAGQFRGGLQVERPGIYRVWIEVDGQRRSSTDFEVVIPSREGAEPAPDPQLLASIASVSGGVAADLGSLDELLEQFPGDEERREPISSRLVDVWDRWTTLIAVLSLLAIEWWVRKRRELV
ncbi:MAG: hypothetical protein AAFZ65_08475, partial [Planctomycetota bacterium]